MEEIPKKCVICGNNMRHVPAGVSRKTGKPYNEFWTCPNNCKIPGTKGDQFQQIDEKLERILNGITMLYNLLKK